MKINKITLIHVLVALITIIIISNCADTSNGAIDLSPKVEWVKDGYALEVGTRKHLYKDDFIKLLVDTHGERVAMYCIEHYRYETIQIINRSDTTTYIVR